MIWSRVSTADVLPTKEISNVGAVSNIATGGSYYIDHGPYDMVPATSADVPLSITIIWDNLGVNPTQQ